MLSTASDANLRKYDVSNEIFLLEPFNHPLITLLTNIGKVGKDGVSYKGSALLKQEATDPEFYHFEDVYGQRSTSVQTTISDTVTTSLVVAAGTGQYFTAGDIIKVVTAAGTEEQMRVTAISTDTLTVTRGYDAGANKLSSIPGTTSLVYIVGNSSAEGEVSRNSNYTTKAKITNYCQIFKTTVEVTKTLDATTLWTENEMDYQNRKKAIEHAMDIERAFWFGKKNLVTGSNGKPERATGGILEGLNSLGSAYIQDESSSALTQAEFNNFLKKAFQYGSLNKWMFASGTVLQAISGFATGALQIHPTDKTYGVFVQKYISPYGEVNLVRNPLFTGAFDGYAVVLDMETLKYRYLTGRDTQLQENIQANDADSRKDQILSECGLDRYNFEKNALLKGVTG